MSVTVSRLSMVNVRFMKRFPIIVTAFASAGESSGRMAATLAVAGAA